MNIFADAWQFNPELVFFQEGGSLHSSKVFLHFHEGFFFKFVSPTKPRFWADIIESVTRSPKVSVRVLYQCSSIPSRYMCDTRLWDSKYSRFFQTETSAILDTKPKNWRKTATEMPRCDWLCSAGQKATAVILCMAPHSGSRYHWFQKWPFFAHFSSISRSYLNSVWRKSPSFCVRQHLTVGHEIQISARNWALSKVFWSTVVPKIPAVWFTLRDKCNGSAS